MVSQGWVDLLQFFLFLFWICFEVFDLMNWGEYLHLHLSLEWGVSGTVRSITTAAQHGQHGEESEQLRYLRVFVSASFIGTKQQTASSSSRGTQDIRVGISSRYLRCRTKSESLFCLDFYSISIEIGNEMSFALITVNNFISSSSQPPMT